MKSALLLVFALLGVAYAIMPLNEEEHRYLFVQFAKQYNKVYEHDQFFTRYEIFKSNLEFIRRHNMQVKIKNVFKTSAPSYTLAMNEHGDKTWEEFRATMLGYKPVVRNYIRGRNTEDLSFSSVPSSIDWVKNGAVTPVKNQEQCGSCWAFSTTGSVEGVHFIATGKLVSLSEQQLVDCSTAQGNEGCDGGLMDSAFEYIIDNGGICSESSYPYTATGPNQCQSCQSVVTISGYKDVNPNDEVALQAAVAKNPVSVAIEADQPSFQFYSSGVFDDASCGTNLDHGVLVVGYGEMDGTNYWKVKNSWGASWGDNGYIYMKRGTTSGGAGICGIAMDPSYPVA